MKRLLLILAMALLSASMFCMSIGIAYAGEGAAVAGYYDVDGNPFVYEFDKNGVSTQIPYKDNTGTTKVPYYFAGDNYSCEEDGSAFALGGFMPIGGELDVSQPILISLHLEVRNNSPRFLLCLFDSYEELLTAGPDGWNGSFGAKMVAWGALTNTSLSPELYNKLSIGNVSSEAGYVEGTMNLKLNISENAADSYAYINGVPFASLGIARSDFADGKAVISLAVIDGGWGNGKVQVRNLPTVQVTFQSNAPGFSLPTQDIEGGSLLSVPSAPQIDGFTFEGWYTDESCTVAFDFTQPILSSTTIYANYTDNSKNYYDVTFVSKTGAFKNVVIKAEEGKALSIPDNLFEYEGYKLEWTDVDGNSYDINAPITDDTTLYAKWMEEKVELYHKLNGVIDKTYVYEYLQDENGWDEEVTNWQLKDTFVDKNGNDVISSFYGCWTPDSSFITQDDFTRFLLMGQGSITNLKKLDVTKEIVFKYSVNNWDLGQGNSTYGSYIVIELFDSLLNALKVIPDNYQASNGAKISLLTSTIEGNDSYDKLTDLKTNVCSKSLEWEQDKQVVINIYISEDGTQNYLKVNGETVDGALVGIKQSDFIGGYAYLHIKNFGSTHCYDALVSQTSNISIAETTNGTVVADVDLTKPVLFKDAITLTLNPDAGYGVKNVAVGEDVYFADENNQVVIYKGWDDEIITVEFAKVYTCSFNSNGGSKVASQTVCEGESFYKPSNPKKDGFKFVGWYTDEALTQEYKFSNVVSSDITLYAKWESTKESGGCSSLLNGSAFGCFAVLSTIIGTVLIVSKKKRNY